MEALARQRREEFVTSEGNSVLAKTMGPDCGCRKKCSEGFTLEQKRCIINILYSVRPNNEHDTYLKGLIERYGVACHRALSNKSKQNTSSYKYFAMKFNSRVEVCRKAYMSLHSIALILTKLLSV